jgi:hypothetical protein
MIKLFLWIMPFCLAQTLSFAQIPKQSLGLHTVYAEAGGAGGLYSVNYERVFYTKKRLFNFAVGTGASYYEKKNGLYIHSIFYLPIHLSFLIHHNPSWSSEIGFTPVIAREYSAYTGPSNNYSKNYNPPGTLTLGGLVPHIGYRYQKEEGGIFAKIYFSPLTFAFRNGLLIYQIGIYPNPWEQQIVAWGGLGIGYTFKRKILANTAN